MSDEIEYRNEYTGDPTRVCWERRAYINDKFQWDEMWCFTCESWQRVNYLGSDRFCKHCEDEYEKECEERRRVEAEAERLEKEKAALEPEKRYTVFTVKCPCGMIGESYEPDYFQCERCWGLMQESEESLRRERY